MTSSPTQWTAVSLDPYGAPAEPRHGHRRGQPPLAGVHRARCGEEWEAIRVLAVDGQRALRQLGQDIGPLVASIYHGSWTFLIEKQPALGWDLRGVRLLRRGTVVELPLPGARRGGRDVRWVVPPGGLTDPALLHQALSGDTPGPPTRSGSAKPRRTPAGAKPRQAETAAALASAAPQATGGVASAPRLASVRHADLIRVLKKRELRESGTLKVPAEDPDGVFWYEMQRAQFHDAPVPEHRQPAATVKGAEEL
ncbi:hypothetical protein [Streptomyces syringium]|uniref:hypothetical protein n=1 Tax=Streptomyces syringium TaxID=76729 RepID=UPI0034114D53